MMQPYITHGFFVRFSYDENRTLIAEGKFLYEKYKEIELFDSEGNFHETKRIYERFSEEKKDSVKALNLQHGTGLIQLNFDFVEIDYPYFNTVDELRRVDWKTLGCFVERKFDDFYEFGDCRRSHKGLVDYASEIEFVGFGTKGYDVNHFLGKNILSFDYKKYNENRLKAIENFPDEKEWINQTFKQNMRMLSFYFMCTVDEIKSPKFDLKKQMMKRLNYKINKKQQGEFNSYFHKWRRRLE